MKAPKKMQLEIERINQVQKQRVTVQSLFQIFNFFKKA